MRAAGFWIVLAAGAHAASLPTVVSVTPSGPEISERLLRVSVTFGAPPLGAVLPGIELRGEAGTAVEGAFLQQELWSPDRRTLTLLLDPGRVKTGLFAHETAGWSLKAGTRATLFVGGAPARTWSVAAGGCVAPDPGAWRIEPPRAGTSDDLKLVFPDAIDGQSAGLIAVADDAGLRIAGEARLRSGEAVWAFTPRTAWRAGTARIVVHPRLENPCGDEVGEAFEHAQAAALGSKRTASSRAFQID